MNNQLFIGSLHRPFNTRLITVKWACKFAKNYKGENFKIDFFIYIIKYLHEIYKSIDVINGLPKKETITPIYNYIIETKDIRLELKKYYQPTEDDPCGIYSTLKATSYYTTLAKRLQLMDSKFLLTPDGEFFASLKQSSKHKSSLSSKESEVLFRQILQNDFVAITFMIFYYRLKKKYDLKDNELNEIDMLFLKELDSFLNIREFRLKQSSWRNFVIVRENWIEDLNILSNSYTIKQNFLKIVKKTQEEAMLYDTISETMKEFEKNFKTIEKYRAFKQNLSQAYKEVKKHMFFKNINYINMYDLKDRMKLSFNDFEYFINRLANDDNNRRKVFFNNIISAVDNRKRFNVKNSAVLNIRITKDLT